MTRSEMEIMIKLRAAVWVTIVAALLAVNAWIGGSNSSKIMGNTIAANNQWAWYQAKNSRATLDSAIADIASMDGKASGVKLAMYYRTEAQRLRGDMDEISAKAKHLEAERDQAVKSSPYFTYAGIALQLGIVLSTAAILAVAMPLFWASVGVGSIGTALFFFAQFGV